jgi:hypothetical protein
MNIKQISAIAKDLGISPKKHNKSQLIHLIQQAEGNFPCYATPSTGECDQVHCLWRQDCLKTTVTKH